MVGCKKQLKNSNEVNICWVIDFYSLRIRIYMKQWYMNAGDYFYQYFLKEIGWIEKETQFLID